MERIEAPTYEMTINHKGVYTSPDICYEITVEKKSFLEKMIEFFRGRTDE